MNQRLHQRATHDRPVLEMWISDNCGVEAYGGNRVRIRDGEGSDLVIATKIVKACLAATQTGTETHPGPVAPGCGMRVTGIAGYLVYPESIASMSVFNADKIAIVSRPTMINTVEVSVIPISIVRQCHAILQTMADKPD